MGSHIAEYNYNHRDELIEKNLHSNQQPVTVWGWLQSVDYSYNAQGWLTGINTYANSATVGVPTLCSPSMPNPATPTRTVYNETSDAFYMDIRYDNTFGGVAGSIQKAGNIAQLAYRIRGRETHIYSYAYDYLNRLSSATFNEYSDAGSITNSNKYNESLTYDLRGNIQTLQRTGYYQNGSTCTYGQIDNLTYTYTSNTNRVHRIQDAVTTTGATARGFNPNGQGATNNAMTYDINGNLNKNNYKNASAITYNHLNLPTLITFSGNNSIEFLYDAAGTKLRKTVRTNGSVTYVQDYLAGGIEYRQNGTGSKRVESVFHPEGRYFNVNAEVSTTISWRREYNIKDHLGNTRVVITDRDGDGVLDITGSAATNEVLQEQHYYAFGLGFEGPWVQNDGASRDNRYLYNGKELNDDFGLGWNDYGARWYDAAVGRWNGVDPKAQKYINLSGFAYVGNNPMIYWDPNGMEWATAADAATAQSLGSDLKSRKKELDNTVNRLNSEKERISSDTKLSDEKKKSKLDKLQSRLSEAEAQQKEVESSIVELDILGKSKEISVTFNISSDQPEALTYKNTQGQIQIDYGGGSAILVHELVHAYQILKGIIIANGGKKVIQPMIICQRSKWRIVDSSHFKTQVCQHLQKL